MSELDEIIREMKQAATDRTIGLSNEQARAILIAAILLKRLENKYTGTKG